MEFIFYYILRRYFASICYQDGTLLLRKGLFFRRYYRIPWTAIRRIDIRRTLPLRLLRGKRVTICTFSGNTSFYLHNNEALGFLPKNRTYPVVKPHFSSVLAGAFSQTKALGGTVLFSITITRLESLFGSVYYDALSRLIRDTANGLDELLRSLRIAVPRLTAALAVFVAAAWLFAFVRNILQLSRYTVTFGRKAVTVQHGVITLYETVFICQERPQKN